MHSNVLTEIFLILISAVIGLMIFQRFRIPEIVGLLLTGIFIGPFCLGLSDGGETVNLIAEWGVVFLLFTLGLEFSIKNLLKEKRTVFIGGALQVGLTIAICLIIFTVAKKSFQEALFLGFIFSLSSTALVLKVLEKRGLIGTPVGTLAISILLFQDIAIVPMILITPILGGEGKPLLTEIIILSKNLLILGAIVFASYKFVIPKLLEMVSKSRSQEFFVLTVFTLCVSFGWLTGEMGMSVALGAFIAGLMISDSPYGYQAYNTVHSFKELFTAFFFISIGMLLDLGHVAHNLSTVAGFVLIISLINIFSTTLAIKILGFPLGISIKGALILSQVGEFSFVIAKLGLGYGVINGDTYQNFLGAGIITMIISPFIISKSAIIAEKTLEIFKLQPEIKSEKEVTAQSLNDHLVIIGFGLNGRNLAYAAKSAGISYIIIEFNPEVVAFEKARGENIIFGDASYNHILEQSQLEKARVVCIAISDAFATRKIVDIISRDYPGLHIIVRTKEVAEVTELLNLGASEVVPEEFETSLEIFSRVLRKYLINKS
ncbi:MAG: cation:proton antiporter, partial [bacterium]|nr:cation:proton antiporter [bacterium]